MSESSNISRIVLSCVSAITNSCTHTLACTRTHMHSHSPAFALTCTNINMHSPWTHMHSHLPAITHMHSLTLTHVPILTCTHVYSQALPCTHVHSLVLVQNHDMVFLLFYLCHVKELEMNWHLPCRDTFSGIMWLTLKTCSTVCHIVSIIQVPVLPFCQL